MSSTSENTGTRGDHGGQIVTAVLVAHDGARWLPATLKALLTQTRPVQRLVAVDTGSEDRCPAILAEVLGEGNLLRLPRSTGFGAAVAEALRHPGASLPVPEDVPGEPRTEWIWVLHDDCTPDSDTLAMLLAGAESDPGIGVLGPKLRDWYDRRLLREMGVSIDGAGRRHTGIDRREFDQGQRDGMRDVLAVGSAGMLVRRDVWDELGGFDVDFGLFREDVDFCWRAHAAEHRVVVTTDAVMFHAEAAARDRREIGMTTESPLRRDRRNALYVLLANLPTGAMLRCLLRNVFGALLRALYLMAVKQPGVAHDELGAIGDVLRSPGRLRRARAARVRNRARVHRSIRRFQPRRVALRQFVELVSLRMAAAAGENRPIRDDDDVPPADQPGRLRRLLRHPGVLTVLGLALVTVLAERSLLSAGSRLGGGALVPAWQGASDLWSAYAAGWHPAGLGSADGAPPHLGLLAVLSTVLFGKPWLAVTVLLLGSVPLAGLTAYRASRMIVPPIRRGAAERAWIRAWVAATYALLPVATGAIATGRLGTVVVLILLPPLCVQVAKMCGAPPWHYRQDDKRARRAAWAAAASLTIAMAFVPLIWPLALLGGLLLRQLSRRVGDLNLGVALAVPPLLLGPWTIGLLLHPSRFLTEAGVHRADGPAPAEALLMLSPGGPGTPALWTAAGLLLAAVVALPLRGNRTVTPAGWAVALFGLLAAVLGGAITVTKGADHGPAWPGAALIIASVGVLAAATGAVRYAAGALSGSLPDVPPRQSATGLALRAGAVVMLLAAACTPLLAAAGWVRAGAGGPLTAIDEDAVPAFLGSGPAGARTLVLRTTGDGEVVYSVLHGAAPALGEAETATTDAARRRLERVAGSLAVGLEGDATALNRMGVRYVMVPDPAGDPLVERFDSAPELARLSRTEKFAVWRPHADAGRLMLLDGASITPLPAGPVTARVRIPPAAGPRTLLLAEPAGGWRATLDGAPARSKVVDGWAQGYDVPAAGGLFELSRGSLTRRLWVSTQGLALLVVLVLALPAKRLEGLSAAGRGARRTRGRGSGGRRVLRGHTRSGTRAAARSRRGLPPVPEPRPAAEPEPASGEQT